MLPLHSSLQESGCHLLNFEPLDHFQPNLVGVSRATGPSYKTVDGFCVFVPQTMRVLLSLHQFGYNLAVVDDTSSKGNIANMEKTDFWI